MADEVKISTRKAFGDELVRLAGLGKGYNQIVVLDADLSSSTMTKKFAEKYPERFYNCGISEADMLGTAAGLARMGKIPVAGTFAYFAVAKGFDQVRNAMAYGGLSVIIEGSHAGISTGEDGVTHQAIEDIAVMRAIPNTTIICPSDAIETKKALERVISEIFQKKIQGPVYFRLGRNDLPLIHAENYNFDFKADVLQEGEKYAIFATGVPVHEVLKAVHDNSLDAKVINISAIKPIDKEAIIETAKKFKVVYSVEDHSIIGGLGSAIAELIAENGIGTRLVRIGLQDTFAESGKAEDLYEKYGLSAKKIYKTITQTL